MGGQMRDDVEVPLASTLVSPVHLVWLQQQG